MAVEKHKTFYWSERAGCLVEAIPVWEKDWNERTEQVYDSAFRMGVYLIAEKGSIPNAPILDSIHECFRGNVVRRYPMHDGSTTSRDQVICMVAGLKYTVPAVAHYYVAKIKYRISKRYFCTPSLWYWLKYIETGKARNLRLFLFLQYIEVIPALLWTMVVMLICGVRPQFSEVEQTGAFTPKLQKQPLLKRLLLRSMYPSFALFLTAMQFYSIGKKSRLLVWYTRLRAPYNNVVRKMFGDETAKPFDNGGPCMNDFWPHRHFDISNDVDLRTVEPDDNLGVLFHNSIFNLPNSTSR